MEAAAKGGLIFVVVFCMYALWLGYKLCTNKQRTLNSFEQQQVSWDIRAALLVLVLALGFLSGCTYTRAELEHVSHPFAGPPFGPENQEDALTQVNYCKGMKRERWYVENCLGLKLQESGFYGPKLTYTGRIGMQWGER